MNGERNFPGTTVSELRRDLYLYTGLHAALAFALIGANIFAWAVMFGVVYGCLALAVFEFQLALEIVGLQYRFGLSRQIYIVATVVGLVITVPLSRRDWTPKERFSKSSRLGSRASLDAVIYVTMSVLGFPALLTGILFHEIKNVAVCLRINIQDTATVLAHVRVSGSLCVADLPDIPGLAKAVDRLISIGWLHYMNVEKTKVYLVGEPTEKSSREEPS